MAEKGMEDIQTYFDSYDLDKDGLWNRDELFQALTGEGYKDEELEEMIKYIQSEIDLDKDGWVLLYLSFSFSFSQLFLSLSLSRSSFNLNHILTNSHSHLNFLFLSHH